MMKPWIALTPIPSQFQSMFTADTTDLMLKTSTLSSSVALKAIAARVNA